MTRQPHQDDDEIDESLDVCFCGHIRFEHTDTGECNTPLLGFDENCDCVMFDLELSGNDLMMS